MRDAHTCSGQHSLEGFMVNLFNDHIRNMSSVAWSEKDAWCGNVEFFIRLAIFRLTDDEGWKLKIYIENAGCSYAGDVPQRARVTASRVVMQESKYGVVLKEHVKRLTFTTSKFSTFSRKSVYDATIDGYNFSRIETRDEIVRSFILKIYAYTIGQLIFWPRRAWLLRKMRS